VHTAPLPPHDPLLMRHLEELATKQPRAPRAQGWVRHHLTKGAVLMAAALAALYAFAPPPSVATADFYNTVEGPTQSMKVSEVVVASDAERGLYSATDGVETYVRVGTNHAWAKLVLLNAGLPVTANNVTVFTRWMRQENGADNWWNRNNPLNNGWGSGGGGGTGSYANLRIAAQKAAEALHGNRGYAGIVAAFAADSPTAVTEAAIWASPWASGHYANGDHWHYTPVKEVVAPAGAW
jgi:hypothetical protein